MKFLVQSLAYNKKLFSVLIPQKIPEFIWFAEPVISARSIFANAEGFTFIRNLFLIASQNQGRNVIYYVPVPTRVYKGPMMVIPELQGEVGAYNLNLILFNYHYTHSDTRQIKTILSSLKYLSSQSINIEPDTQIVQKYKNDWRHWKLQRTLNTKLYKNHPVYNYHVHSHADLIGTSKDNGLDLIYYFPEELEGS
jgi:hypothetical protein